MKKLLLVAFFFIGWKSGHSQFNPKGSGELLHELEKLKVMGSAMYIAAHPDDENTLLITWLANDKKVRTSYISMTRGDGGQNLLGTEKGEFAGLLRTHELLGARSIDGGEQFFTRANDFGYTKTTEEALATWDEEKVFSDLVYRIRKFQPDVLITRFPPDARAGHGHHSASSLLAEKAFTGAADPEVFPEQLEDVSLWQPTRLVWNYYGAGFTNTPPEDGSSYIKVDVGRYNSLLGASYGELGLSARSMHKSQGFGTSLFRGSRQEVLKHTLGEPAEEDLFDGIKTTWGRIKGGEMVTAYLNDIIRNFNAAAPERSVPALLQLRKFLNSLPSSPLLKSKKRDLDEIIPYFAGLYLEALASDYSYAPGEQLEAKILSVNRTSLDVKFLSVSNSLNQETLTLDKDLELNSLFEHEYQIDLPKDFEITQPYWLKADHLLGSYEISDEKYRNLPLSPPAVTLKTVFSIGGEIFEKEIEVKYKYVVPSYGEIYRPLEIRPEVTITPNLGSLVFNDNTPQSILVTLKASKDNFKGQLNLQLPEGWESSPASVSFELENKYDEKIVPIEIKPSSTGGKGVIQFIVNSEGKQFNRALHQIKYDHIPETTSFPVARISALKLDLKKKGKNIGYIMGAGDEVPKALEQMGYNVHLLSEAELSQNLKKYDAILIGVRAYNVLDWLPFYKKNLLDFVKEGGNLICQYQTRGRRSDWDWNLGPYDFEISRDRVSQEDAEVRYIDANHPLLNYPNKITAQDFEGWVQERGLYFANNWASEFQLVFSMNDTNETAKEGSLIIAPYGKGNYIYTGISFFRELPAGVPGAYRLMANLISAK